MDKKLIETLDIKRPVDWLTIELRANISEDYDLISDIEIPEDFKKIAYQIILQETIRRTYRKFEEKIASK